MITPRIQANMSRDKTNPLESLPDDNKVSYIRSLLGISQPEMGRVLGRMVKGRDKPYSYQYIHNMEKGMKIPNAIDQALTKLHAEISNETIIPLVPVTIMAPAGSVVEGAIFGGESPLCKHCDKPFIKTGPNQRQCLKCKGR